MSNVIISLDDIWFSYDGISVLEGLSLDIYEDDFLGIIGPNGGGKSTLLKIILGLIVPDKGEVMVFGETPRRKRRLLGYVPQYSDFDRDFPITVKSVVSMGRLKHRGLFRAYGPDDMRVVEESMRRVEILDLADRQIGKLSGGQLQRVFLARALASEPRALLLDEPTSGVDQRAELDFFQVLHELNEKMTIVMVSHDIGMISTYVKTIACLNHRMIYNHDKEVTKEMLDDAYQCPVDLIAHGLPHRVFDHHDTD